MTTRKKSTKKGKPSPSMRRRKLEEGVLRGKTPAKAARDAGYSESFARVDVYRTLANPSFKARIQERIRDAQIDTNEIIGTLVSQMRGDFYDLIPEDEFMQAARARGVSHLVKEVKITKRTIPAQVDEDGETTMPEVLETKYEIKIHDAQGAAKHLCNVFGLEKLPALNPEMARKLDRAVDRFIEKATKKGLKITPDEAREKLLPLIQVNGVQ